MVNAEAAAGVGPDGPDPSDPGTCIISRRVVLPVGSGLTLEPARVWLRGSLIERVEVCSQKGYEAQRDAPGVIDFDDKVVSPAFVNGHSHLALVFLRGVSLDAPNLVEDVFFRLESLLSPEDIAVFTEVGAYECLLNGVGMVWDHYYHGHAVADGIERAGLSAVVAPTLQDLAGPGKEHWEAGLEVTEQLAAESGGRGIWAALGPHATDTVSAALLERSLSFSERLDLPVHLHVAQSVEEVRRLEERASLSPMAYLKSAGLFDRAPTAVLAHGLYARRKELMWLEADRHRLAVCPASQAIFGFPVRIDQLEQDGVPWLVATDCAASNDAMSLQKELRWCAAASQAASYSSAQESLRTVPPKQAMLPAAEALWSVRNAALAGADNLGPAELLRRVWDGPGRLHPRVQVGTISPGSLANLVVWDPLHPSMFPGLNPLRGLAFGETSGAIHAMWVAGRQVSSIGSFGEMLVASARYQDAVKEALARLGSLLVRANG